MLRVILAVVTGYCFIGVLIFSMDQLFAHMIPGLSAMKRLPDWYFATTMLTDTVYTFLGGWLCAAIARGNRRATLGLIVVGELVGIASTFYLWNQAPHFYSFFLLIVYPPAVWFGAKMRKSRRR